MPTSIEKIEAGYAEEYRKLDSWHDAQMADLDNAISLYGNPYREAFGEEEWGEMLDSEKAAEMDREYEERWEELVEEEKTDIAAEEEFEEWAERRGLFDEYISSVSNAVEAREGWSVDRTYVSGGGDSAYITAAYETDDIYETVDIRLSDHAQKVGGGMNPETGERSGESDLSIVIRFDEDYGDEMDRVLTKVNMFLDEVREDWQELVASESIMDRMVEGLLSHYRTP